MGLFNGTQPYRSKEMNILVHGVPSCVIAYKSYKLWKRYILGPPCSKQHCWR